MEILAYPSLHGWTEHQLTFFNTNDPEESYPFPCDFEGWVDVSAMTQEAKDFYFMCLRDDRMVAGDIEHVQKTCETPMKIKCDCRNEFYLWDHARNECEWCHKAYNGLGKELL